MLRVHNAVLLIAVFVFLFHCTAPTAHSNVWRQSFVVISALLYFNFHVLLFVRVFC